MKSRDELTLVPVPNGTLEMRYTAQDAYSKEQLEQARDKAVAILCEKCGRPRESLGMRYFPRLGYQRVYKACSVCKSKAKDAIQHVAVEPRKGGFAVRAQHGENSAERMGFKSAKKAEHYGESILAKLAKQAEASPKFRSWKVAPQYGGEAPCPVCKQQVAIESGTGRIAPHTKPYVYGVQKNFKLDPVKNPRYACKGTGAEVAVAKDAMRDQDVSEAFAEYMNKANAALTEFCRQRGVRPTLPGVKQSMVDALLRDEFGAERYTKWMRTPSSRAKDGILSSPLLGLAALIYLLSKFHDREEPTNYDLTTYQPKKRKW